jgi:hypothetical protein
VIIGQKRQVRLIHFVSKGNQNCVQTWLSPFAPPSSFGVVQEKIRRGRADKVLRFHKKTEQNLPITG